MAAANANDPPHILLKDMINKASIILEQVHDEAQSSSDPSTTGVRNDEYDLKGEMSTCHGTDEDMNLDKEASMEDLISNLHIGELPTIPKQANNGAKPVLLQNNMKRVTLSLGKKSYDKWVPILLDYDTPKKCYYYQLTPISLFSLRSKGVFSKQEELVSLTPPLNGKVARQCYFYNPTLHFPELI
ncbi:hypothetical protein HAX54_001362 [Datura stramonium]|uniref:Uncharacterized protein n=1 Tax=Datura stramonium TaxID=4076 RepID=A0ABS8T2W4_DATST|nr:hypothetical protein [Datura stramonium]